MKTPYLIQRLQRPYPQPKSEKQSLLGAMANVFSFGGGLKNGGISDEAMKLLREVWRYDYMGSAEFEWGAVPKSLFHISENAAEYVVGQMDVVGRYRDYRDERDLENTAPVYFACKRSDEKEVREWIVKFANDKKRQYSTKESVGLAGSICGAKYYEDKAGWHDIENHYLFFTDKEMFGKFAGLFGIGQKKINETKQTKK